MHTLKLHLFFQNADLSERLEEEEANSAQLSSAKKKFEKQCEELTHDVEAAESNINRLEKDKQVCSVEKTCVGKIE